MAEYQSVKIIPQAHWRTVQGYSLIELLTVMSILSLLLLYASAQFHMQLYKSALESNANKLGLAIKIAKSSAIRSSHSVVICRKQERKNLCVGNDFRGRRDWSAGWLVFSDANRDKLYQLNERLIKSASINKERCAVHWNRGDYISFHRFAVLQGARAGTFTIGCGQYQTQLIINWVGRVRRQ